MAHPTLGDQITGELEIWNGPNITVLAARLLEERVELARALGSKSFWV